MSGFKKKLSPRSRTQSATTEKDTLISCWLKGVNQYLHLTDWFERLKEAVNSYARDHAEHEENGIGFEIN